MACKTPSYRRESPLPPLPEAESTSTMDSAERQHRRMSNNPYRQRRDDTSAENPPSGERKRTPTRAVFTDLSSAHSSIMSGKAKLPGSRNGLVDKATPGNPILLQDLNPANRPNDYFGHMPLLTLPAMTFSDLQGKREGQFHDINLGDHVQAPQYLRSGGPGSSPSLIENIKSTLSTFSSPLVQAGKPEGSSSARWPRPSPGIDTNAKPGLVEAGRNAFSSTKARGNGYPVNAFSKEGLNSENLSGSSVYPSSPPVVYIPVKASRHTNSSHNSESVQYNSTRDREYSEASRRVPTSNDPRGRKALHSTSPSEQVSIPDGSTVGNIYNHYLHSSNPLDDFSDDDEDVDLSLPELNPVGNAVHGQMTVLVPRDSNQDKPSALAQRIRARANRLRNKPSSVPPQFSLPDTPNVQSRRIPVPPSSTNHGQSSSYGDTHELLSSTELVNHLNQGDLPRSEARSDLRFSITKSNSDVSASSRTVPPQGKATNPFARTPRVTIENVDENHVVYDNDEDGDDGGFDVGRPGTQRKPLEREISEALRLASGNSTYSIGSYNESILDKYRYIGPRPRSTGVARASKESMAMSSQNALQKRDTAGQSRGMSGPSSSFYAPGAVAPSCIEGSNGNTVRVPIIHRNSTPASPPHLSRVRHATFPTKQSVLQATVEEVDEDVDDWETVAESGFLEVESGFMGGGVKRAGSSIANVSDYGGLPDFDDFASSDRVTQHPVHPQYQAEYRQRDLKNSRVPVFAPVYREHKVNGYLADSNRVPPHLAPHGYAPPPSLRTAHPNPFQNPPPPVMSTKHLSLRAQFQSRRADQFQPSMQSLSTDSETADHVDELPPRTAMTEEQRREWMQDFNKHKLTLISENEFSKSPSPTKPSRPSSWQRMMDLAADGAIIDFNGTFVTDETKQRSASASEPQVKPSKQPGWVLANQIAKLKASASSSKVTPNSLSSIPGGVQYKILHKNGAKDKERSVSAAQRTDYRQTSNKYAKKYPTNRLRPLSLVDSQPPSSASSSRSRLPSQFVGSDDYVYRSPCAPPKQSRWRMLYSSTHLQDIEEAAKNDGLVGRQGGQRQASYGSDGTPEDGFRRHVFETPTLLSRTRDDSARTDLTNQRLRFSIAVLCLCNLCPPFFLLYYTGHLDGIMLWWTDGQYSSFARKQKQIALYLAILWVVIVIITLVAILVWRFT